MARMNTDKIVYQATKTAERLTYVANEEPVRKAAKQALGDVTQAGRSVQVLADEAQSAWRRSDNRS